MRSKKSGARRWVILGGGLLALWVACAAGLYLWARSDSAFQRWVMNRGGPGDGEASFAEIEARLHALHAGSPPCLRHSYTFRPDAAELRGVARELLALGIEPEVVAGLLGQFLLWSDERENGAHEKPAAHELAEVLGEGQPLTKLVLRVQLRRLEETLSVRPGEHHEAGRQVFAALTPVQQRAVRSLWEANPQHFALSSILPLLDAMKRDVTLARLDALSLAVRTRFDRGELEEVRLEELAREAGVPAEDGWGKAFVLDDLDGRSVRLGSYSYLGEPEALSREVRRPGEPNEGRRAETSTGGCEGPPGPVALRKAELDAALDDVDALSRSARVVPAFVDGEVKGFKLLGIRAHSLFDRVGLCNGDVVRRVNGVALSSPESVLEAYSAVRDRANVRDVRLELERLGEPQTLHVQVR